VSKHNPLDDLPTAESMRPTGLERERALLAQRDALLEAAKAAIAWVAVATANQEDRHPRAIENAETDLATIKAAIAMTEGEG